MTSTPPPAGPETGPGTGHQSEPGTPGPTWPTDQPAPMGTGPRVTGDQVRDLGRLRRITVDRKLGGVAGGVARHLDIDPLVVRVAFVVLSLFGGAGLVMYAAGWILLPEDGEQRQPLGLDDRSRSVALILAGVVGACLLVGQWDWFWIPGPVILVALVVWLVMSRRHESAATPPPAHQAVPPIPPGAGPDAVTPEQRWGQTTATAPAYERAHQGQAYQQAYQQAHHQGHQQATHQSYLQPPKASKNPRKRGPKLFWFTLALAALGVGVVGIVDVSGAPVPGSLYPAVVLAVVGAMLVVGSFFGRAGGLILVGLIAALVTGIGLASEKWDGEKIIVTPETSAELQDFDSFDMGEYRLDLTRLDPQDLDDRHIEVTGDVGELDVIVPDDVDVTVNAEVNGPGGTTLFGESSGPVDTNESAHHDGSSDAHLTLDLQIDVGHIDVRTR